MGNVIYVHNLRTYKELSSELPFLSSLEFTAKDSAQAKGFKFSTLLYQDRSEEPLPSPRRLACRLKKELQSIYYQASCNQPIIIVTVGLAFSITVEAIAKLRRTSQKLALIAFQPRSDVLSELEQLTPTDEAFQKFVPLSIAFPSTFQCRDRTTYFRNAAKSPFNFIDACPEAAHKLAFCELILPPHETTGKIPTSVLDFYNSAKGIKLNTTLQRNCTHKEESAVLRDSIYRAIRDLK